MTPVTRIALINNLRGRGERITAARREILNILYRRQRPLSAKEFSAELKRKKLPVNKTTVYRQLSLLESCGIARPIRFADRTVRYEIAEDDHHHHLVCTRCRKIEKVSLPENLARQTEIIRQKKHFKVSQHSLEFYGLCQNCQKKEKRQPAWPRAK